MDILPVNGHRTTPLALSRRESEILRLIAWGYTLKEIAAKFALSAKTIETYKMRGLEKLGIKSRVDLVRHALKSDWFAEDPELSSAGDHFEETMRDLGPSVVHGELHAS